MYNLFSFSGSGWTEISMFPDVDSSWKVSMLLILFPWDKI